MKITVVWDVMPCSLVDSYQGFGVTYYFHHTLVHSHPLSFHCFPLSGEAYSSTLKMQTAGSAKTTVIHSVMSENTIISIIFLVVPPCSLVEVPKLHGVTSLS
jgi:hypothetical protein